MSRPTRGRGLWMRSTRGDSSAGESNRGRRPAKPEAAAPASHVSLLRQRRIGLRPLEVASSRFAWRSSWWFWNGALIREFPVRSKVDCHPELYSAKDLQKPSDPLGFWRILRRLRLRMTIAGIPARLLRQFRPHLRQVLFELLDGQPRLFSRRGRAWDSISLFISSRCASGTFLGLRVGVVQRRDGIGLLVHAETCRRPWSGSARRSRFNAASVPFLSGFGRIDVSFCSVTPNAASAALSTAVCALSNCCAVGVVSWETGYSAPRSPPALAGEPTPWLRDSLPPHASAWACAEGVEIVQLKFRLRMASGDEVRFDRQDGSRRKSAARGRQRALVSNRPHLLSSAS